MVWYSEHAVWRYVDEFCWVVPRLVTWYHTHTVTAFVAAGSILVRDVLFEFHLGIPPELVFQLEVYHSKVDRLLTDLTAKQKGTTSQIKHL